MSWKPPLVVKDLAAVVHDCCRITLTSEPICYIVFASQFTLDVYWKYLLVQNRYYHYVVCMQERGLEKYSSKISTYNIITICMELSRIGNLAFFHFNGLEPFHICLHRDYGQGTRTNES